jgi:hypothetical protein
MLVASLALAQDYWLSSLGPGELTWGGEEIPLDARPRLQNYVLPDSAFLGRNKSEKPDDLEVRAPPGERRFLRYVHGVLVDAWWVAEHPLDPTPLTGSGPPAWQGVILGPDDGSFLAYGLGASWTSMDRTILHWRDSEGKLEVIADRAAPSPQYGIGRPAPLVRPGDNGMAKPRLAGDFKKEAKAFGPDLATCFGNSPKPVEANIKLKLDRHGRPSRIRVDADQPTLNLQDCVAAALIDLKGLPGQYGTLTAFFFR